MRHTAWGCPCDAREISIYNVIVRLSVSDVEEPERSDSHRV
jgi:hypothetical protein